METQSEPSELELDDVVITNPHIEAILENEEWIEDASYGLFTMSFSVVIMIIIHKISIISHLSAFYSSYLWLSLSVFLYPQRSSVSLYLHPEGNLCAPPCLKSAVITCSYHTLELLFADWFIQILIAFIQICHTLTEKLVAMTMGSGAKVKAPASLSDIISVAKRISPRYIRKWITKQNTSSYVQMYWVIE